MVAASVLMACGCLVKSGVPFADQMPTYQWQVAGTVLVGGAMMLSFTRTHAFSVLVNRLADIIFCSCLIYCRFFLVPCFFYLVMLFPTILLYFIPGWSGSAVFSVHAAPSQCDLVWHQGKVPRHRRRHQLQPGDGSWYSMIAGRMMGDDSSLKLVAPVHAPFLHFLALFNFASLPLSLSSEPTKHSSRLALGALSCWADLWPPTRRDSRPTSPSSRPCRWYHNDASSIS